MTLTTRLTLFYLGALGSVLTAFSITLYLLAHHHLHQQLHDRAAATLATLMARAEIDPEGVEWELKNSKRESEYHHGAVFQTDGERLEGDAELERYRDHSISEKRGLATELEGQSWHVVRQTIAHPNPETLPQILEPNRYRSLTFVVAYPTAPVDATLRTLASSLAGSSLLVWIAAAFAARWVCRRALRPVAAMAGAARQFSPNQLDDRLPLPLAKDELHDLAGAFNDLLTRRQNAFERQKRFTGEASHQLRTPLAAMLGQIEVALRRDRDPGEYRSALSTAKAQALRLHEIVECLLFLARADAEAHRPELRGLDLRTWLGEYLHDTWRTHVRWPDVRLHLPTSAPILVKVHPVLFGQMLGNLLENALKFSPPGSDVDVRLDSQDGIVSLAVTDRGCGISEKDQPHIFEPFFRAASARTSGMTGVGLGLAITARIVETLGGQLTWHSATGTGSHFQIEFPA